MTADEPEFCQRDHFLGILCGRQPGHEGDHIGWFRNSTWVGWDETGCARGRVIVCRDIRDRPVFAELGRAS